MKLSKFIHLGFLLFSFGATAQMQLAFEYRIGTMTGSQPGPWIKFENPAIQNFWINGQRGYVLPREQSESVRDVLDRAVSYGDISSNVKQEVEKVIDYFSAETSLRESIKDYIPSEIRPSTVPKNVDIERVNSALDPIWKATKDDNLLVAPDALEEVEDRIKRLSPAEQSYARSEVNRLFTYPTGQLKNLPYLPTSPVTFNAPFVSQTRPFIRALNDVQVNEANHRKNLYSSERPGAKLQLQKLKNESEKVKRALKIEEFKNHYFNHKSQYPNEVSASVKEGKELVTQAEKIIKENSGIDSSIPQPVLSPDEKVLSQTADLASCIERGINCGELESVPGGSSQYTDIHQKVSKLYNASVRLEKIQDSSIKNLSQHLVSNGLDKVQNDAEDAGFFVELATSVTDIGVGFVPVVGTAKDLVEFVTGKSLLTGEELDTASRAILATAVMIDLATFGTGGRISKAALQSAELSFNTFARSKFAGQVGKHWEDVSDFSREVLERVRYYEFESPTIAKAYSRLHEGMQSIGPRFKIQDVKEGLSPDKVAIIGRKMKGAVNDVALEFRKVGVKVETFKWSDTAELEWAREAKKYADKRIPYNEVLKTIGYKENKEWAEKLVREGYTIFDIGDPLGSNVAEGFSAFYDIENIIIWGRPR